MQLRTNGPVVSAYRWLYGISRYKLGNNFCPIFWMMVLGAVLIIPYAIFCLPVVLHEYFDKNYRIGDRSFGERLGISIFVYLGLAGLFMIGQFVGFLLGYYEFGYGAVPGGALITAAGIIIATVYYGMELIKKRKDKAYWARHEAERNGEHIPDSIGKVIQDTWSAFYDKHCPRITWIDPKDPTPKSTNATEDELLEGQELGVYNDLVWRTTDEVLEGQELGVYNDPVLGTTYGLKNITNKETDTLNFPNLKD